MCVICLQYQMGKLTRDEARTALKELILTDGIDPDHIDEVIKNIEEVENEIHSSGSGESATVRTNHPDRGGSD